MHKFALCLIGTLDFPHVHVIHPNPTDASYLLSFIVCFGLCPADIPAGWGMVFNRTSGSFTASKCPADTYGVEETAYSLKFTPCKPCPRGLVTNTLDAQTSKDACTNKAGYGWNGFTAEKCAVGTWATADSMLACTSCPLYRNTTAEPFFVDSPADMPLGTVAGNGDAQDRDTDCKVIAGYGVSGSAGDAAADQLALEVLECAVGTYSIGGALNSTCTLCSDGAANTLGPYSTTEGSGSTTAADCKSEWLLGLYMQACGLFSWINLHGLLHMHISSLAPSALAIAK